MTLIEDRRSAIHLLRAGQSVNSVAVELGKSTRWVRKWRKRYQTEGWDGLKDRCRRPHNIARQTRIATKLEMLEIHWWTSYPNPAEGERRSAIAQCSDY